MAAILGEQAPDVFAGVGIMAGVALHRSHDVASAFVAMSGNKSNVKSTAPLLKLSQLGMGNLRGSRLMTAAPMPHMAPSGLALFAPVVQNDDVAIHAPEASAVPDLPASAYQRLRVMIWTGADDVTVAPSNAHELANQFLTLLGLHTVRATQTVGQRGATISAWKDASGMVRVELWSIPQMGHGWSGGSAKGSYTFPQGPDATAHTLRYFLLQ